nr:hypothetical protein [Tanacetum cinerariifolium]
MELDEHVSVHVLKPEHPEYHAPSDDDIQVEDDDEDPNEEHEPQDEDTKETAYETELQEVHQAYLSSEALNRELLARLEML